jgi:hypothetical protein
MPLIDYSVPPLNFFNIQITPKIKNKKAPLKIKVRILLLSNDLSCVFMFYNSLTAFLKANPLS